MAIDPRLAKLLGTMKTSIQPPEGKLPDDFAAIKRIDPNTGLNPEMPAVSGDNGMNAQPLPDRGVPRPTPVRVGMGSRGLTGVDKSLANLSVQHDAARDFPSSKTTSEGEILPPKMHHGIGDRLKSIGSGIVLNMGEYARTHPGASTGELLGAGGAGGAVSGVSPVTGDAMLSRARLQRSEGDVARELDIAKDAGQTAAINAEPALRAEKIRVDKEIADAKAGHDVTVESDRVARDDATRKASDLRDAETARNNRDRASIARDRNEQLGRDKPKLEKPEPDTEGLISNMDKRIGEYQSKSAGLRQQADALKDRVNTDYGAGQERDRLLREADAADNQAASLRGQRDKEASKPKRATSQGPSPSQPETRKGSITKSQQDLWLSHNPGKTLDDMKKLYPNAVMQ